MKGNRAVSKGNQQISAVMRDIINGQAVSEKFSSVRIIGERFSESIFEGGRHAGEFVSDEGGHLSRPLSFRGVEPGRGGNLAFGFALNRDGQCEAGAHRVAGEPGDRRLVNLQPVSEVLLADVVLKEEVIEFWHARIMHNVPKPVKGPVVILGMMCLSKPFAADRTRMHPLPMRLREIRKAAGLNQAQLGEMILMDQTTISRAEKMHKSVKLETYILCAEALKVSLSDLFGPPLPQQSEEAAKAAALIEAMPDGKRGQAVEYLSIYGSSTPELQAQLEAIAQALLGFGTGALPPAEGASDTPPGPSET